MQFSTWEVHFCRLPMLNLMFQFILYINSNFHNLNSNIFPNINSNIYELQFPQSTIKIYLKGLTKDLYDLFITLGHFLLKHVVSPKLAWKNFGKFSEQLTSESSVIGVNHQFKIITKAVTPYFSRSSVDYFSFQN